MKTDWRLLSDDGDSGSGRGSGGGGGGERGLAGSRISDSFLRSFGGSLAGNTGLDAIYLRS